MAGPNQRQDGPTYSEGHMGPKDWKKDQAGVCQLQLQELPLSDHPQRNLLNNMAVLHKADIVSSVGKLFLAKYEHLLGTIYLRFLFAFLETSF